MSGYIKIHRALFDHPVVGFHVPAPRAANGKRPVPPFMAWEWLCAKAAFRPHQVNNKGRVETLERGQLLAARAHLASEWGWTEQNVRTFLKNLHAHHMVEINQSTGHYTAVLTVCNYDVYQGEATEDNQSTNQSLTRESPETNHTEEREEGKEKKEITPLTPQGANVLPVANWNQQFHDQHSGGVIQNPDGSIDLVNGTRAMWLSQFGGDETRLNLAIIQAAGEVQPRSRQPLRLQIERSLARIAGQKHDSDQRYKSRIQQSTPATQRARQEDAEAKSAEWREMFGLPDPTEEKTDAVTH